MGRHWARVDCWHAQSADGYTVAFSRTPQGDCQYLAFAPAREVEAKAHYAIGERVPQRHELIGCYATAEEARAACDEHDRKQQREVAHAG